MAAELGPVSGTALVTLWFRAVDARSAHPVLGDRFAADVLAGVGFDERRWRPLRPFHAETVARARRLDDVTRDFVAAHPDAVVVQLACGLDSRALRVDPPQTVAWLDLDLPEVVAIRRRLHPRRAGVRTLAASATDAGWWADVPTGRPLLLLAEGLFMYLAAEDVATVLRRAVAHAPMGEAAFDGVAGWTAAATRAVPDVRGRAVHFRSSLPTATTLRSLGLTTVERAPVTGYARRYLRPGPGRAWYDAVRFLPLVDGAHTLVRATF